MRIDKGLWRRVALSAGVGGGLAVLTSPLVNPKHFISDDVAVALVSDTCPISHEVVQSAATSREVKEHVIPIPIDIDEDAKDSKFQVAACTTSLEHIRRRAPWLHALPDAWLCRQLTYYGARLHRDHFVGTPSYVVNGQPSTIDKLDQMLHSHGLGRSRGLIFPQQDPPFSESGEASKAAFTGTVRGSNLGF